MRIGQKVQVLADVNSRFRGEVGTVVRFVRTDNVEVAFDPEGPFLFGRDEVRPAPREARLVIGWIPGFYWVQLFAVWNAGHPAGSEWRYANLVHQRTWRLGRLGLGWMTLPRRLPPYAGGDQ